MNEAQLGYWKEYYKKNKLSILIKQKEWRRRNKERINKERRDRYWADAQHHRYINQQRTELYKVIRYDVLSHYSNGTPRCNYCGVDDIEVLCIDHVEGGGKEIRGTTNLWGAKLCWYLKRNDYPTGFQILCANCNLKKSLREER